MKHYLPVLFNQVNAAACKMSRPISGNNSAYLITMLTSPQVVKVAILCKLTGIKSSS